MRPMSRVGAMMLLLWLFLCPMAFTSCEKIEPDTLTQAEQTELLALAPELRQLYLRSCEIRNASQDEAEAFARDFDTFCAAHPIVRRDTQYYPQIIDNISFALTLTIEGPQWKDTIYVRF